MLYKGFIETKGKRSKEPLKGRTQFKTLEQVQHCDGYAGVLADDTILIDIDDGAQAEKLMNIVEQLQLNCRVYQTSRGKHFLFKNKGGQVTRNRTHVPLAIGLTADIKLGMKTSYEVIKIDGQERFCEWDIEPGAEYQELPTWLIPVKTSADFVDMEAGDGRNDALFKYILTLTGNGMTVDETRECIKLMNQFVLKEPLEESELDTILRDEAFQKPVFFIGSSFQHDRFADFLIQTEHVIRLDGQLHIFHDGSYTNSLDTIAATMRTYVPKLKKSQKAEVLDYLSDMAPVKTESDSRFIAFKNGVLDTMTATLTEPSPEFVISNVIPWDYVPGAYNELTDRTLNRSNGKSTFLKMLTATLGELNVSALDLKNLGDRFSKASLYKKLANIGDDISDDFIPDTSLFKKITDGGRIEAEYKGQKPFDFNPYAKLIFSANDIPRMKDKTGAVLRRLVIIPFNARFSPTDADYNPDITRKLTEQSSIEYLIRIGVEGLRRVIDQKDFTQSDKVDAERAEYNLENNPVLAFLADQEETTVINQATADVYRRYQVFCSENGFQPVSNISFSKQVNRELGTHTAISHIGKGKDRKAFKCYVR